MYHTPSSAACSGCSPEHAQRPCYTVCTLINHCYTVCTMHSYTIIHIIRGLQWLLATHHTPYHTHTQYNTHTPSCTTHHHTRLAVAARRSTRRRCAVLSFLRPRRAAGEMMRLKNATYPLTTHYPLTIHSLPTHLYTHYPLTFHSPSTHRPLTIHSLSAHYPLTIHPTG
jgi:hypothetical protein